MNHSKRDEKLKNNDAPNGNSVSNNQSSIFNLTYL